MTKQADFNQLTAREVDFVTRFTDNWEALQTILGITRPIKKEAGTRLVSYKAKMVSDGLQGGASVGEGEEIPYTEFGVDPVAYGDVAIEKYAKAVSIEAVAKYGPEVAVQKTDDQFLVELQNVVFVFSRGMRKTVTDVVGFANINDLYGYLGTAEITIQTAFGLTYVQNFMGYSTLFLCPDIDIPQGTVIAVPIENIDMYYVDPSDSAYAQLGLQYTTQGETNLIGFHAEGDYKHAVGEVFALMGITLWAEYLDGIAVATVGNEDTTPTGA